MTCTVQLFAGARDAAGSDTAIIRLAKGATVGDLRQALVDNCPNLRRYGAALWIAINGDYAADDEPIPGGAEIACFPPVSGG